MLVAQESTEYKRIALIIANSNYPAPYQFPTAETNAKIMYDLFTKAGFETIFISNTSQKKLTDTLNHLIALSTSDRGLVMLYYTGNAMSLQGKSYLLNSDVSFSSATEMEAKGVDLNVVTSHIDKFEGWEKVIILNSCQESRWNFTLRMNSDPLQPGNIFIPRNSILLTYHTACYADIDSVNNFTQYLVQELSEVQPIEKAFKNTRTRYMKLDPQVLPPLEISRLESEWSLITPEFVYNANSGSFTDKRNGREYKWVRMGNQIVMCSNLYYTPSYSMNQQLYESQSIEGNTPEVGNYYTWNTAIHVCPEGWHLPNAQEWNKLIEQMGGEQKADNLMKGGLYGDLYKNSVFQAHPSGLFTDFGQFSEIGESSYFWSSTPSGELQAQAIYLNMDNSEVESISVHTSNSLSVRCFKNLW